MFLGENILIKKMLKNFTQKDGFRRFKLKLRQFIGKEPKLTIDINLPTQTYSGWVVVPEVIHENDIVYSLGICDDISFELDIIKRKKVRVFAFDPTPYSVQWIEKQTLPPSFKFFSLAAAGKDGTIFLYPRIKRRGKKSKIMYTFHKQKEQREDGVSVDALTIESMAKKLGHQRIDILKIDIEGAEYEVLKSMLNSTLRPKLLLLEFHHRFKGIGKEKTIKAIASLRKAGYLKANLSVTGREICFVNKSVIIQYSNPNMQT